MVEQNYEIDAFTKIIHRKLRIYFEIDAFNKMI